VRAGWARNYRYIDRGPKTTTGTWSARRRHAIRRAPYVAAVVLAALTFIQPTPAGAGETVGVIRNFSGTAFITRGERSIPAVAGTKLFAGDTLVTGRGSSVGAILRDDSTLSLGEESSLVLRQFDFSTTDGKFGIMVRITRGTMAYLSGLIGKLAPDTARFETPVATIGIRGTRFAVKVGNPAPR
jgi:hypothetical protein